jgi:hypothetical protein
MIRIPIRSSNIRSVGYDENSRVLEVEFTSGGIYQYHNVPDHRYASLVRAGSKGEYFHGYIRNNYRCVRVRS